MIYIETPRLLLRDWSDADLPLFAAMNADPAVMEFFPGTLTPAESEAFYRRIRDEFADSGYGLYAVERKIDGCFIGYTGLHRALFEADFTPCIEIGWRLCHAAWGNGFAPEAAAAVLDYAFGLLGMTEVCSFTAAVNLRSQRVMEKIGMEPAGRFVHPSLPRESPLSEHVLYRARIGNAGAE